MSWLDEQIAQAGKLRRVTASIEENGPKLYDALWAELSRIITEANEKGFGIDRSGSNSDRTIEVLRSEFCEARRSIRVVLSPTERKIKVTGSTSIVFDIAICEDRIVCLKVDGVEIPPVEAAQKILAGLLFPDVQESR